MTTSLIHYVPFPSEYVPPRPVDIWLPPGYDSAAPDGYPVLYMHDGQNVFNPESAYIGVAWEVDKALVRLLEAGRISVAPIVVAIWNDGENRVWEYMPEKPFAGEPGRARLRQLQEEWAENDQSNFPCSDVYLRFLVEELKPFVDGGYNTRREREQTFIMGSSMGGLISLYAVCEYPEQFGGAGCVSTHWPGPGRLMLDYLQDNLPAPRNGFPRIYFDHGTVDVDSEYGPYQQQVDEIMREAGYREGKEWVTRVFEGADHSERAWQKRVEVPLAFLLTGGSS